MVSEFPVQKDGKKYFMRFERGVPVSPLEEKGPSDKSGTIIRWKPDSTIFTETITHNFDVLSNRLRELAFLNSGIIVVFRDERLENPKEVIFKFEGGIRHFVSYLNENKTCIPSEPIYITGEKDDILTEVALQYNEGYTENILSFVNDINTREGGTHLEGLKSAITKVMNEFLKSTAKLQKKIDKDEKLTKSILFLSKSFIP